VRDIPILIGGQGEKKTLRMVAEYAHIWHGFTDASSYPAKAEVLDAHCADVGRDPAAIERSSGVPEKSVEQMIEGAESLVGLGVTLLTMGVNGPDYDLGPAEALVKWRDDRAKG
jgi:alkanesulfonate monooxygenase SsuD/methylene tetrahydromethanopterin reductase-like flavin-dependent oxidoreductase (luciferase family)